MASKISDEFRDLFEKKAFAHLATVMKDGTPQVTPVWCDYDGTYVRINSAKGRLKDKNIGRSYPVSAVESRQEPQHHIAGVAIGISLRVDPRRQPAITELQGHTFA